MPPTNPPASPERESPLPATAKLTGAASLRWQSPRAQTRLSLSAMPPGTHGPDERRRVTPDQGVEPVEPVLEQAVLPLIRKHWIVLARGLVGPLVVGFVLSLLIIAFGGGFVAPVVLAVSGVVAAWVWLRWIRFTVTVTDERVIIKEGVFISSTKVIPLSHVQDVLTRQNVLGQVLGYGSLEIDTAGRGDNELIPDLPAPVRLREQVFALLDRFQRG